MKEISTTKSICLFGFAILLAGCDSLRFAPSEQQKQNAWLHNRTAIVAAETARAEDASEKLQALTGLSELQSQAFTSYFGLPKEFPKAASAEEILAESNWQLATQPCSSPATGLMRGRLRIRRWSWGLVSVLCWAGSMAQGPLGS